MIISADSTDVTVYFKLVNPSTGVPETGLTITSLYISYVRDRATIVTNSATELAAVDSAHADNKMKEVDSTYAPGLYRADFPDAAFASGVGRVQLIISGAAVDPAYIEVELDASVNVDKWNGTSVSLTEGYPNVNSAKVGGNNPAAVPTNFASMAITAGGVTQASLRDILGTAITESNAGDVAESFSFFFDVDPVTTRTVNDVGGSTLTAQNIWEYGTRTLTVDVGDATLSNQTSMLELLNTINAGMGDATLSNQTSMLGLLNTINAGMGDATLSNQTSMLELLNSINVGVGDATLSNQTSILELLNSIKIYVKEN